MSSGFPRESRNVDARSWHGDIPIGHKYTMGVAGERFFQHLKKHGEITATIHEGSEAVGLPPRLYDTDTFAPIREWVTVGPGGTVETFTIVRKDRHGEKYESPRVLALVRVDGAEGGLMHWLGNCDPSDVTLGMRVRAVFEEERTGGMSDIRHFEPA